MSYPTYNPYETGNNYQEEQRRRIEEDIRRAQEFERIRRVRDVHRPHLG